MVELSPDDKFLITLTLPDGEEDKGVRAFIRNDSGANVTPAPGFILLEHISNGLYMNASSNLTMPLGKYVVQVLVYSDDTFAQLDEDYGASEEIYSIVSTEEYQFNEGLEAVAEAVSELADATKLLKTVDFEVEFEDETDEIELSFTVPENI